MLTSDGIQHLIALAVVALAVVVQSVATTSLVGAEHDRVTSDYGVRLLPAELRAPVPPAGPSPLALLPPAAAPPGSAATLSAARKVSARLIPPSQRAGGWRGPRVADLPRASARPSGLERPFPNRDAAGTLVEIAENDVLVLY